MIKMESVLSFNLESLSLEDTNASFLDAVSKFVNIDSGDVIEQVSNALASQLGLHQKSDKAQTAVYIFSKIALLELAENVFNIGSGFSRLDLTAFTIMLIMKIAMRIEEKLDIIMDTPLQIAIKNFKTSMNLIPATSLKLFHICKKSLTMLR